MEPTVSRRRAIDVAATLSLALAAFLVGAAPVRDGGVTFQLGPNDSRYLDGFVEHYEIADGVGTRWTTYHAKIDLPLTVHGGPVAIAYRYSRVFGQTAQVEVRLAESTVDRFEARGGSFETRTARLAAVSRTPLSLRFEVDSHERRNLGLKLDWLTVKVGPTGGITTRGFARWLPVALAAFFYLLFRFGGLGPRSAFVAGLAFVAGVRALLQADVYGFSTALHSSSPLLFLLPLGAAFWLRRFPKGALVVPIFVFGLLLRGLGLFHPTTFYPDVGNARDYVEIFRETKGSLAERGVTTQKRTNVGFPRTVAGKDYAFPYSPLYFLPFGLASTPGGIEDAVRYGGLAASSLVVLPLFGLASRLLSPGAGALASLLWTFSPPIFSRLLLALHATVVGNLLDVLVIVAVFALMLEPSSRRRLAVVFATTLPSLLVYTSSLFSMTAFFLFVSLLERRLAPKLLAILAVCSTITVTWLYWPFLRDFVTEIAPALSRGLPAPPTESAVGPVPLALSRIPLFYGYVYPVLAAFGLFVLRRRSDPRGFRLVAAWGLAFVLMLSLRAFGGGLFKDLKEITFLAPWVAMLSAASLAALAERGRFGKVVAVLLTAWLVVFGLERYRSYLELYASPVTRSPVEDSDRSPDGSAALLAPISGYSRGS